MSLQNTKKLLVVDDDELMREVICDIFSDKFGKIFQAENGKIAFEIVKKENIDIVMSDVRMPDGDGIELAKNLLTLGTTRPKLFMCSGFNDLNPEMISQLKIIKVFEKPFDDKDMIQSVLATL